MIKQTINRKIFLLYYIKHINLYFKKLNKKGISFKVLNQVWPILNTIQTGFSRTWGPICESWTWIRENQLCPIGYGPDSRVQCSAAFTPITRDKKKKKNLNPWPESTWNENLRCVERVKMGGLLGEDGKGYELARKLEAVGVWRTWLGDSTYPNLASFLSSPSAWDSFFSSKSRALLHLQLRVRALLFDKASAELFTSSPNSLSLSTLNPACQSNFLLSPFSLLFIIIIICFSISQFLFFFLSLFCFCRFAVARWRCLLHPREWRRSTSRLYYCFI